MADSNTYISISHAASLANVSKETIRNLCKRGAIGYEMHANFVYPCKEDVERYAESIATVHASEQELERYKLELQEQVEQLRLAKTNAQGSVGRAQTLSPPYQAHSGTVVRSHPALEYHSKPSSSRGHHGDVTGRQVAGCFCKTGLDQGQSRSDI